jgi:hypothetical protein
MMARRTETTQEVARVDERRDVEALSHERIKNEHPPFR